MEKLLNGYGVFFGVMKMIEMIAAQRCDCTKCHQIEVFKMFVMVSFIPCEILQHKKYILGFLCGPVAKTLHLQPSESGLYPCDPGLCP